MTADAILFQALIVPHRSLSRRGLTVLTGVIGAICVANAGVALAIGAWPVAGFTGLELLLAAVLLRLNLLAARDSELVMLSPAALHIVRTDRHGRRSEQTIAPGWLSVLLTDRPGRVPGLLLVSHGRTVEIARFLGEAEKRDLAQALAAALHAMRNPRFENPGLD